MDALQIGLIVVVALLILLATGMPIAFALGLVSVSALFFTEGLGSLDIVGEKFFTGLAEFGLVSIPMFILMGAAVASSPAGRDLYEALDRWLNRVPGGLVLSNIGACSIFAALSGSSPATCAAIGKMGIPEMQKRGYPDTIAAGSIAAGGTLGILIPPSVTMIVYGIATESSIGRLFLAGVLPGLMLTALFMAWAIFASWRHGYSLEQTAKRFSLKEKFEALPRVLPFLAIIIGILYVLYGGVATPSEAAGAGALFCIVLVIVIYQLIPQRRIDYRGLGEMFSSSIREAIMIMMIIGASELFSYTLSLLYVTQTIAENIAALEVNRWVLMGIVNLFLLVAGFFLPPVAVILMTAPILLPIITQAGFTADSGYDVYWFAVIFTINMEIGLITPPVGLNLYVINGIAPTISLKSILAGSLPFVLCMILGIVLLCFFPEIATWLPEQLMGPVL